MSYFNHRFLREAGPCAVHRARLSNDTCLSTRSFERHKFSVFREHRSFQEKSSVKNVFQRGGDIPYKTAVM